VRVYARVLVPPRIFTYIHTYVSYDNRCTARDLPGIKLRPPTRLRQRHNFRLLVPRPAMRSNQSYSDDEDLSEEEGTGGNGTDEFVELDLDKTLTWKGNAVIVQRGATFRMPLLVPNPSVLAIQFEVEGGYDLEFSLTFKEDGDDETVVMVRCGSNCSHRTPSRAPRALVQLAARASLRLGYCTRAAVIEVEGRRHRAVLP